MILYYVRHGDPTYSPDALTPLGHRQAEAVGRRIAQHGIDKIYSSTSTRAYETAKPLSEILKKEIVQLPWCHEKLAYSDLTVYDENGKRWWVNDYTPARRIFATTACRKLGAEWYDHPGLAQWRDQFKAGMDRVSGEVDKLLLEWGYAHDREEGVYREVGEHPQRVALFAHAGFGRMFLSSLLDISYAEISIRTDMGHTGVTVIEFPMRDGVCIPRMLTYSNDAHIYAEHLPTHYNHREFI